MPAFKDRAARAARRRKLVALFRKFLKTVFNYGDCDKCKRRDFLFDVQQTKEKREGGVVVFRIVFEGKICRGCWAVLSKEHLETIKELVKEAQLNQEAQDPEEKKGRL